MGLEETGNTIFPACFKSHSCRGSINHVTQTEPRHSTLNGRDDTAKSDVVIDYIESLSVRIVTDGKRTRNCSCPTTQLLLCIRKTLRSEVDRLKFRDWVRLFACLFWFERPDFRLVRQTVLHSNVLQAELSNFQKKSGWKTWKLTGLASFEIIDLKVALHYAKEYDPWTFRHF